MRALLARIEFILLIFIINIFGAEIFSYPDVTIIQQDAGKMIIEWKPQEFKLQPVQIDQGTFQNILLENGASLNRPGEPDIPWRNITIGLPAEQSVSVTVLDVQTRTVQNVDIAPVPVMYRDRSGVSNHQFTFNDTVYQSGAPFPKTVYQLGTPARFRDLPIQAIRLSPVQYYPAEHRLVVYERIRLQINFSGRAENVRRIRKSGFLDKIARTSVLNFEQARNWRAAPLKSLKKAAVLPAGPFYKITVKEDGLYKITPSVMETAGIDLNNLPIAQIKMYNNGGHELNYNTRSSYFNPEATQEIPILVFDLNNNQKFDGSDYILFYGKQVNGWFHEPGSDQFVYQQHKFARQNVYWLNVNGGNGLRMVEGQLSSGTGSVNASYFYDRYHFEEDLYNLLSSGPDWYGYRFFGRSGGYSKNIELPVKTDAAEAQAEFKIQFKGGSGIRWTDNLNYRYEFKITMNNRILFSKISFNNSSRIQFKNKITDLSVLTNGENSLSIQYQGNRDGCNVYIDWFEIIYPRDFKAVNDRLLFYTEKSDQAVNYTIDGLSDRSDFYVFDVTDPVNPIVLGKDLSSGGGKLSFTLPPSSTKRQILVSSLNSPGIKTVTDLKAFTPREDLLNPSNQADYIVVTHKTFLPYAKEIADLHKNSLTSKVVSMEDIYFYFNSGVPDPTALRNFLRYAYNRWTSPAPSYVLLFGDAHYDYRNINIPDTMRVPTWEIYNPGEIDSRATDDYFVDLDYGAGSNFSNFTPDLASGRIPVESILDCERVIEKIKSYLYNSEQDGWQTNLTLVADDQVTTNSNNETIHQNQSENIAKLSEIRKFILNRVYLSTYPSVPGGFIRVKPEANNDLIDYLNQGTLIVNYIGHGNPTQWAHEGVFVMDRDYPRIQNEGRICFLIAATCDFGKFDDPHDPSFTEALIWKEKSGIIGALASTRLAYSSANYGLASGFFKNLFPGGGPSIELGVAKLRAVMGSSGSSVNDQKYVLFADPAMRLIDPQEKIKITKITPPDTLKALSTVKVEAQVLSGNQPNENFSGSAVLIVHDAAYQNVNTGQGFDPITLIGPRIFKGEVDVSGGLLSGSFIVPKSIRYVDKPTGRITLYAYSPELHLNAMGYNDRLLINGSESNITDEYGPEIDVFFKDQENFTPGDLIPQNTVLIASLQDDHGINITGEMGHNISLQIDNEPPRNISGFFAYEKNSYQKGKIEYPLSQLAEGPHRLKIEAFDNLNNLNTREVEVKVAVSSEILLTEVVNYPNPFKSSTRFTFQTNVAGADVKVKIYTVTGRLIQELYGTSVVGYNDEITWDGTDRDGDEAANGVYLYKIILKDGNKKKEKIEKLVIMR
ncbi:MAG: type IX secretion system sortase PorU [Calditrichaeota bacterium]|nr:type IX secretion system sortase PorU [Calditrichota bacterium]